MAVEFDAPSTLSHSGKLRFAGTSTLKMIRSLASPSLGLLYNDSLVDRYSCDYDAYRGFYS